MSIELSGGSPPRGSTRERTRRSQKGGPERSGDVVDLLYEPVGIAGDRDEAVVGVEGGSRRVDRVDDHESRGGDVRGGARAGKCVPEQLAPEPLASKRTIERESSQEDRRDGVRRATTDLLGHLRAKDEVGGQAEVRNNDSVAAVPDEGPSRAHRLRLAGMAPEPQIERVDAAGELADLVVLAEGLRNPGRQGLLLLHPARRRRSAPQRVVRTRGSVEGRPEALEEVGGHGGRRG